MTEAERLAERLLDLVSNFTKPSYRNTLTDSAALIRSQSARIAALEEALRAIEDMETDWALGIDGGMENARRAARKALGKRSE